ncbi:hypothetical protein GCM10009596_15090 [Arthrobacter rhombi]
MALSTPVKALLARLDRVLNQRCPYFGAARPRVRDQDMNIVPGGIVEQFRQAFSNVLATLEAAGGRPEELVSVTIYLTDVDDYMAHGREIGRLWREMAGTGYPAMAGIGVSRLWQKEALIEIQGVAVISAA